MKYVIGNISCGEVLRVGMCMDWYFPQEICGWHGMFPSESKVWSLE
jgi:hypothetical protein